MRVSLPPAGELVVVDFEFHQPAGHRPTPICMVAKEVRSGRVHRVGPGELQTLRAPPFPHGPDDALVAYFASAEHACFQELGWGPMPTVDLYAEYTNRTNGASRPGGRSLLAALAAFGVPTMTSAHKEAMRDLAIRGGPFTASEVRALIDYCQEDVDATADLLTAMQGELAWGAARLRGAYTPAVALMERTGIPVDVEALEAINQGRQSLRLAVIEAHPSAQPIFNGLSFSEQRFESYLAAEDIAWPRLDSGRPALDSKTFRAMATREPRVAPIAACRSQLGQLRKLDLAVGPDDRNRVMLSPFASRTGRNQPSTSRFVFGASGWMRGIIQAPAGQALAYVDWEQQEFGIAAHLSGDAAMAEAYGSGDPYLTFAKQAGAAPRAATKQSHPRVREKFKACALAVQYGMGAKGLADRLAIHELEARDLLRLHRSTYARFWAWSDALVADALLCGDTRTAFGWRLLVSPGDNPRMLQNFPMQAHGAEMLRLACRAAMDVGIELCAPVHDALLVMGPIDAIEDVAQMTQRCMAEASRVVLAGPTLRTDVKVIRHPDRFLERGHRQTWDRMMAVLGRG